MTDAERLDWLADQMPFDGFAGLDLHEIAAERLTRIYLSDDPVEDEVREADERNAYRWAMRELIDRASAAPREP